ncbi:hypothetical protein OsI_15071 [Oryza sativa Indica Group]|uniref:Uncharacterized protein n=1 Tax=Oryza sativa subsp. indica TaxID=39946 RepID=B8AR71_ORYSI|nr:hypothetical protein OsI_15071 [Oryza sativa Indica Group]
MHKITTERLDREQSGWLVNRVEWRHCSGDRLTGDSQTGRSAAGSCSNPILAPTETGDADGVGGGRTKGGGYRPLAWRGLPGVTTDGIDNLNMRRPEAGAKGVVAATWWS